MTLYCQTHNFPVFTAIFNSAGLNLIKWAIPEKNQTGGLKTYFLEKNPGNFRFFTLPLEIPDKAKLPQEIPENCVKHLESSKVKTQHPWEFYMIFSRSPHALNTNPPPPFRPHCLDFLLE